MGLQPSEVKRAVLRENEKVRKYDEDNGSNISQCQRRKVKLQQEGKLEYICGAELEWET